jgi:hypothetical protein
MTGIVNNVGRKFVEVGILSSPLCDLSIQEKGSGLQFCDPDPAMDPTLSAHISRCEDGWDLKGGIYSFCGGVPLTM